MIFLDLSEGLGNQMFQYAFAKKLQEVYGDAICLDIISYERNKGCRKYSLSNFILSDNIRHISKTAMILLDGYAKLYRKIIIQNNVDTFDSHQMVSYEPKGFYLYNNTFGYIEYQYNANKKIKYVLGSWMNPRFFNDIRHKLLADFSLKEPLEGTKKIKLEEIRNCNSVCVHIRRGDYLTPEWSFLNVCGELYYKRAFEQIKANVDNPVFYIFSNSSEDLAWIKNNYKFLSHCDYVDMGNADYEDLELMKNCKHFIISNSTYSWWAQYLAEHPEKIVTAPDVWSSNGTEKGWNNGINPLGIYQKNWDIVCTK